MASGPKFRWGPPGVDAAATANFSKLILSCSSSADHGIRPILLQDTLQLIIYVPQLLTMYNDFFLFYIYYNISFLIIQNNAL